MLDNKRQNVGTADASRFVEIQLGQLTSFLDTISVMHININVKNPSMNFEQLHNCQNNVCRKYYCKCEKIASVSLPQSAKQRLKHK